MAGLFKSDPKTKEGKYLVTRRDGTIPIWPHFVIAASDPAAPIALRAYANQAEALGMDPKYVDDIRRLAEEFIEWRAKNGTGDPDAPAHRKDDPETIAKMATGGGA